MTQLTQNCIKILSNFSTINNSIYIKANSPVISTISDDKTIIAEANSPIQFPIDFALYDLKKFLSAYLLLDSPEENPSIEFFEKSLVITGENKQIEFFYCSPQLINYPKKSVVLNDIAASFQLPKNELIRLQKAAAILGCENIIIEENDEEVKISVKDQNNKTSDSLSVVFSGEIKPNSKFVFNIEKFKFISESYEVYIDSRGIGLFHNDSLGLKYYVQGEFNEE